MTILLFGATSLLTVPLAVLLVVVLWGPERIYQRMLELIKVLRGGGSSQSETTPCQDADTPAELMIIPWCTPNRERHCLVRRRFATDLPGTIPTTKPNEHPT